MDLVQRYKSWLLAKGYATRTMESYLFHVGKFLASYPNPLSATSGGVESYLESIKKDGCSLSTMQSAFYAVKNFFFYLSAHGGPKPLLDQNILMALRPIRRQKRIPKILTNDDLSAVLRAPDLKTVRGCRDYCIMLFLLHGLRAAEICTLDVDRIFPDGWGVARRFVIDIKGKGRKERRIIMERSGDTEWAWKRYINMRNGDNSKIAFPAILGKGKIKRLTTNGLYRMLIRYGERLSISNIHPHVWRHTTAVRLLEEGVQIKEIQTRLGHESLTTTDRYLQAAVVSQTASSSSQWIGRLKKADARFRRWRK